MTALVWSVISSRDYILFLMARLPIGRGQRTRREQYVDSETRLPMRTPVIESRLLSRMENKRRETIGTYRLFIQLDMLARNVWGSGAVQR